MGLGMQILKGLVSNRRATVPVGVFVPQGATRFRSLAPHTGFQGGAYGILGNTHPYIEKGGAEPWVELGGRVPGARLRWAGALPPPYNPPQSPHPPLGGD